jgi:peptide deformylase
MAELEILHMDNPVLARLSKKIKALTPELLQLAEDMIETMQANAGLGLAAPQVGQLVRMIAVLWEEGPTVYINPKITRKWGRVVEDEACLSLPGYMGTVERYEGCIVRAQELGGA